MIGLSDVLLIKFECLVERENTKNFRCEKCKFLSGLDEVGATCLFDKNPKYWNVEKINSQIEELKKEQVKDFSIGEEDSHVYGPKQKILGA